MVSPHKIPLDLSDIYIDESSQTGNRYLVLGGIIMPTIFVAEFERSLYQCRLPELPAGETKWVKVSRAKLNAYRRIVDFFFDSPAAKYAHFHSLIVDTTKLDHALYNQGSREIGFSKEVYQLAMKFGRNYRGLFHVYPDRRETNQKPEDLRLILNRGQAKSGDTRDWPFRRCQFRESAKCLPIQMVDVLIGAIAYRLNGHYLAPDASPAKCDLSEHVLRRARVHDAIRDTTHSGKFTIWHRRLKPSVPRP